MERVLVIGAGISGLVAALRLKNAGRDVLVLEASTRTGGVIRSQEQDGYLIEYGPNSIQGKTDLITDISKQVGIEYQRQEASDVSANRYIVRDGRPIALPSSPGAFLATPLFSPRAKLRLFKEPFVKPARADAEESVATFVERRLGREFLDYAINPFVAGVYAGAPEQLSLRHAFPRLFEIEQQYGSLIKGMIGLARQRKRATSPMPTGKMFSYWDGLESLPRAIAAYLGDAVRTGTRVARVWKTAPGFEVTIDTGETFSASSVIYTGPAPAFPDIQLDTRVDIAPLLDVTYPSVWTVALGYRRDQVTHPLDGFGLLVPSAERRFEILGTLFSSSLFPKRAPEGHVLLTSFVGGTRHPEMNLASEETVVRTVRRDLSALLGVAGEPTMVSAIRVDRAIPQYRPGYQRVKDAIDALEAENPGFFIAGNYRQGISVHDAARCGWDVATRLTERIA